MRWTGHVLYIGEARNAYIILIGKPEGKLGRSRRIKEDSIKVDIKQMVDRCSLAPARKYIASSACKCSSG